MANHNTKRARKLARKTHTAEKRTKKIPFGRILSRNHMITPTIKHARKLRDLMREHGIVEGLGDSVPGKMCIEALVCYVLELPHGDNPKECVGLEVNKLKIGLNDKPWSSPFTRAKGMERLGIAQLGSNVLDQKEFRDTLWLSLGQQISPLIFVILQLKLCPTNRYLNMQT